MTDSPGAAVRPAAAATLIIVRPAASAPEILLLKRSASARFMPGAFVFPGGAVDGEDGDERAYRLCAGIDDAAASAQLGLAKDGLRYFVAALREAFEECGLLYAYDATTRLVGRESQRGGGVREPSAELLRTRRGLCELCTLQGWRLAADRLAYFAHWITPPNLKRRFDTRFFIAPAPEGQLASLAGEEMSEITWIGAREALTRYGAGTLDLRLATRSLLQEIAQFDTLDALLEYARAPRTIMTVTPSPMVD